MTRRTCTPTAVRRPPNLSANLARLDEAEAEYGRDIDAALLGVLAARLPADEWAAALAVAKQVV